MKDGIIQAGINAIKMTDLNQLSSLAKSSFEIISNNILEEIKNYGLEQIYEKITSFTTDLKSSLPEEEIEIIKRELEKIPDTLIDTELRI